MPVKKNKPASISTISLEESFNQHKLFYIINNEEKYKQEITGGIDRPEDQDPFLLARKYLAASNNGTTKVRYLQNNSRGRFYAEKSLSLQTLCRKIRHTIANETYIDIDMVNAHPTILLQYCIKNSIECPALSEYINNRDKSLTDLITIQTANNRPTIDTNAAKQVFLALLNGGVADYKKLKPTPLLQKFKEELQEIHCNITDLHAKEWQAFKTKAEKSGKTFNLRASFVNHILLDVENECLQAIWKFFNSPTNCVFCFDGIMLNKSCCQMETLTQTLTECASYVNEQTGYSIKLKHKPMDEGLELPDDIPEYNETPWDDIKPFDSSYDYYWIDFECYISNRIDSYSSYVEMKKDILPKLKAVFAYVSSGETWFIKKTDNGDSLYDICRKEQPFRRLKLKYYAEADDNTPKPIKISLMEFITDNLTVLGYSALSNSPIELDRRKLNSWHGFAGREVPEIHMDLIKPILDFIREVVCSDETERDYTAMPLDNSADDLLHYVLSWFANGIQRPEKPNGSALVMVSNEGTGKNTLLEFMRDFVYGKPITRYLNGTGPITQKHNTALVGRKLIVINEVAGADDTQNFKAKWNSVKTLLTEDVLWVEPKGVDAFQVDNFANYVFCSNNFDSIYLAGSDRRYTIIKFSEKYMGNEAYFTQLRKSFTQEAGQHFYTYLLRYRCRSVRTGIMTDMKRDIIEMSLPSYEKFINELKEARISRPEDSVFRGLPDRITPLSLYRLYCDWCNENGYGHKVSMTKFGLFIKDKFKKIKTNGSLCYVL